MVTPAIGYDPECNIFSIIGNSIPEDVNKFYRPAFEWLKANVDQLPAGCTFRFSLPYMSSSSLKAMFHLLNLLREGPGRGSRFTYEWYVDDGDESMMEAGEIFAENLGLRIELKQGLLREAA